MNKFVNFSNEGLPVECILDSSEWAEIIKDNTVFYRVPDYYDFENNIAQFVLLDGKIKELTESEAIYFQINIYKSKELEKNKLSKIDELNIKYSNSMVINITNSFSFKIDLQSKYGLEFLKIIQSSIGSYSDIVNAKKKSKFYIEILEDNKRRQIQCVCYNWIWLYLFDELLSYVKDNNQFKEIYRLKINNINDIESLKKINIEFTYPNGLNINISRTIEKLLSIDKDGDIEIPIYVKDAIVAVDRKLFTYSSIENINSDISLHISNSWLNE
jgi:hypothetical protein